MPAELVAAVNAGPPPLDPIQIVWLAAESAQLLFVAMAVGGSLLAAVAGAASPHRREVSRLLVDVTAWAVVLAITLTVPFAVAPLPFVQGALGRFFESAAIPMAPVWLGMLGLLLVGALLNYFARLRIRARRPPLVLPIAALCLMAVAVIQAAAGLLRRQPGRWEAVADGIRLVVADPGFVPRLLHLVLAAVTLAGLVAAWSVVRRVEGSEGGPIVARRAAAFGVWAALIATLLQLMVGFWQLLALPEEVLIAFLGAGPDTLIPLGVGALAGGLLLVVLARIVDPLAQPKAVQRSLALLVGALAAMLLTRHQLRGITLAASRVDEELAAAANWEALAVSLAAMLLGVSAILWFLLRK